VHSRVRECAALARARDVPKVGLINVMQRQQSAALPVQPPPTLLRVERAGAAGGGRVIYAVSRERLDHDRRHDHDRNIRNRVSLQQPSPPAAVKGLSSGAYLPREPKARALTPRAARRRSCVIDISQIASRARIPRVSEALFAQDRPESHKTLPTVTQAPRQWRHSGRADLRMHLRSFIRLH